MVIKTINQISGFRIVMRFITVSTFRKRNLCHSTAVMPPVIPEKYRHIEAGFTIFIHIRSRQIIFSRTSPSRIFPCRLFELINTISRTSVNNRFFSVISSNRITSVTHSIRINLLLCRSNTAISSSGNTGRYCMYS